MGIQEPRLIDEIEGKYDGRIIDRIQRENGKVDFKVRLKATARREILSPRTVTTDYRLDPDKDIIEVDDQNGERRIYLVPVSADLQVHRDKTVHQRKMRQLEKSFKRDDQRIEEIERENRRLKRRLARLSDGTEQDESEQSADPQQRYKCKICGNTATENQKEENEDRCPKCNRDELELID